MFFLLYLTVAFYIEPTVHGRFVAEAMDPLRFAILSLVNLQGQLGLFNAGAWDFLNMWLLENQISKFENWVLESLEQFKQVFYSKPVFRGMISVVMADPPWDIHMELPLGSDGLCSLVFAGFLWTFNNYFK